MNRRGDDDFPRETLAERIATTRARQAERDVDRESDRGAPTPSGARSAGHSTAGFHRQRPPSPPASWAPPPPVQSEPASPPPPIRHCWYRSSEHGPLPALLLKWRALGEGRFDGFICTVALDDQDGWMLTEMWVEASMLSPA